jgi:predicted acylesterase/phospholipase RssA
VALVCAGGGVTGAVYEIGALRALEDLLDRSVLDFDLYVGVSGGAFVASLLAHGVSPREMYEQVASRAGSSFNASDASLFRLGLGDFLKSTRHAPRILSQALMTSLTGEGRSALDLVFALFRILPPGLLENSGIQEYLARVFKSRGKRDRFDDLSRPLYVVAVDLDAGEAVAFGEPGRRRLPVSKAVQASTAVPGLYRPVRIQGRDYVDGGVKKTAHINLAIRHGADLVICINPIVPLLNDGPRGPLDGRLSEHGVTWVLDQVFRIALHGRMQYGLERYKAEHPDVDILLVEPARKDMRMFSYDIMRLSARRVLVEDGYRSVLATFRNQRAAYARLLARHGIRLRDPAGLPELPPILPYNSRVARSLGVSLDLLESRLRRS